MDEIDFKINLLLMINARLSYREIANYLGLTINAVYKRVQSMIESGIIQKFRTRIKPSALNSIYGFIFGKSEVKDIDKILNELGSHENTAQVMLSSRNYVYIGAYLRNIHELDPYSTYISQIAKIEDPTIGFLNKVYSASPIPYNIPSLSSLNLNELDYAILRSLHDNARKPISDIAEEVSRTPNTVRRRLSKMIEENVIDLTIDFNPISSNDIFYLFQITLPSSTDKHELAQFIIDQYHPHIYFIWTFSNLPHFITCFVWCNTMKQVHGLIEKLKQEQVDSIIPDVLYKGLYFDTWIDELFLGKK
ncbi:MAG: winged helix-turn-helix transcriptional regulator [Candidatus Helarchaeota archaeon]